MMDQSPAADLPRESDFSARKIGISLVVLVGTLFGSSILPMFALSLILLPMTAEFGWTRTEFSGGLTALMWAGACSGPLIGRYVDRVGVRPTIITGTVIVGLLVMGMSLMTGSLVQFYFMFGLLGVIGSTAIGYSKVIGSLFTEHRGKALAIFGVESSLAGATTPILCQYLISEFGWRGMFVGLGSIILAVVPLIFFFLPEPEGQRRQGQTGAPPPVTVPGLPTRQVLRTRTFWIITIASFIALGPASGLMPHYVPYLMSRGFGANAAVTIMSGSTIAMAAGTMIGGWATDRARSAFVAVPFSILSVLALGMFMVASGNFGGMALLLGASSLLGFAGGAKRPMGTYFHMRFFGLRSFAEVQGLQMAVMALGMGLAPVAVGWVHDHYGTYQPAFWAMLAGLVVAVILYAILPPYHYAKDFSTTDGEEIDGTVTPPNQATVSA